MKWLLAITMLASTAVAQPIEHPAQTEPALAVEVIALHGELDANAVRDAIAHELDIAIVGPSTPVPSLGLLRVAVADGAVHISYLPVAGDAIERDLAMPPLAGDRVELVAYAAANMIRDQVRDLLASLQRPPPPVILPPVIPPPAPPPIEREVPATLGFVPPLSIDRLVAPHAYVGFGVHALVGENDGSRYASISGLADIQRQLAYGLQVGGVASIAGATSGLQIGGVATITRAMYGMQLGGVTTVASRVDGAQIAGVTAIGGDVHGAQISLVNVAGNLHGMQLGLVNVSDGGDDAYPIGLFNFARNGGVALDGWAESTRLTGLALRHGARHLHNVWTLGWSPDYDHVLVGAGLGTTLLIAGRTGIDIDAVHWWTDVWSGSQNQLDQLRATLAIPIGPIDLLAGAAANVYVGDAMDERAGFRPLLAHTYSSSSTNVVGWPTLFAGLRVHAR